MYRLPLPPITISNSSPFSHSNSAATSPSAPRSPGRVENPVSPESHWKKGKMLGRGTFGHVYVGFNSDSGEMCAMKEVTLFDDAKSKESAKQLMQEIVLLSRLQHPNIVQYYGSKTVEDKLYIYLEYVSGGSIYKLLQDYGQFGEPAIRNYTQQILSGLAFLHSKHTVHRDIKGANILVDPNGRVKLADFGMAKHIAGQSCPLSFKGSPYWMAPEVIKNSSGCNLAVDIWSLGCTVLEMATAKRPWSQYEGVAAMFKIGNSKELPTIPDHLSDEGKDFIRLCLQRNPLNRPTAVKLLDHPFVKGAAPLERTILVPELSSVHDSVETVNAAATAIVSAESRLRPAAIQKRRWGSCWSLYWCFGSHKTSKRISHAVLVPEPMVTGAAAPAAETQAHSTAIVLPFIAPPSSPASFLQSDPPSATQSPAGLLSLNSLSVNAYSPGGPASMFAIGPYAHETQLVTPPVFSAFTTEPSTALCTPPPESVQLTTPSSPEVPFAQLLTSSLERARRNSGTNQKLSLSHYGYQPYQLYPGSPGGQLISPGSVVSYSGTSSPFPDRHPILDFSAAAAPKLLGFEHFTTRKWGSRLGSGSVTPDGVGIGSRMGSGSLTPDGVGLGSRLGSGTVTPDGAGLGSRLGSGSLTPDGMGPTSGDGFVRENQISEVASLANSDNGTKSDEHIIDHRVSFELSGEEVARCLANKSAASPRIVPEFPQDIVPEGEIRRDGKLTDSENHFELCPEESSNRMPEKTTRDVEEEYCYRKHRSITLGSIKEFNFDNTEGDVSNKPSINSEWWANENVGKESKPSNNWTFFPMLQSEAS